MSIPIILTCVFAIFERIAFLLILCIIYACLDRIRIEIEEIRAERKAEEARKGNGVDIYG